MKESLVWLSGYVAGVLGVYLLAYAMGVMDANSMVISVMALVVGFKAGHDVERAYKRRVHAKS